MSEYNKVEQEVIVLNAVCGMIDEMVNFAMFRKPETFENIGLLFSTSENAQLFNILLCDFYHYRIRGVRVHCRSIYQKYLQAEGNRISRISTIFEGFATSHI